ncbi:MAG: FecR domain-containing protein [Pyrinomonadaceae bacterium]
MSTNWPRLTAAALVLLIAVASSVWLYTRQSATPADDDVAFWEVAQLEGAPKIGVRGIQGTGQLRVGEWLETDNSSRTKINVGEIGHVEVDPNSRLRLVEADESEHRLSLVRGRLSAVIWAPPRLFFVDTPSAVAVDYGCAYTLEVDESGGSLLQVTSGWVALELDGQESMVPAGAACETRPVTGPGTPYFFDAPPAFRAALRKFDFESGSTDALADVLREARKQDTLSIWHLLARAAPGEQRHLVYTRLAQFISPPAGVTKEGALRLDREMLQRWRDELQAHWFTE